MRDEMEFHTDRRAEQLIAHGMSHEHPHHAVLHGIVPETLWWVKPRR